MKDLTKSRYSQYFIVLRIVWKAKDDTVSLIPLREEINRIIKDIAIQKKWEALTVDIAQNEVRVSVSVPPTIAPSEVAKTLKGQSARKILILHPDLTLTNKGRDSLWEAKYSVTSQNIQNSKTKGPHKMKTIAFFNQKGGVGKTASAITVAYMMSEIYHKRVLLVDLDAQANSSLFFGNVKVISYLQALLKNQPISTQDVGYSLEDLLLNPNIDVHKAIQKTKYENLDIVSTFLTLSAVESQLKDDVVMPQQFRLKNHFAKIQDEYDYCILDCSPSVNIVNINGLALADKVYIPMKCDAYSASGMAVAKQLIQNVAGYNPKLQLGGVFFTQWDSKRVNQTVYELLMALVPHDILPVRIPRSKLMEEISFKQEPLYEYDRGHTPKSTGVNEKSAVTKAYMRLTEYIMKH